MLLAAIEAPDLFEGPLVLVSDETRAKQSDYHITALIGRNGAKKSLALRLAMEAGLGKRKFRGYGYKPVNFEAAFTHRRPSNVIAISNTPWDRFPRHVEFQRLSRVLASDGGAYVYIGQRTSKGQVSVRGNEVQLGTVLMEHAGELHDRAEMLSVVFNALGLRLCAGIRLVPGWAIRQPKSYELSEAKLNKYLRKLREVADELQLDRSVRPEERAAASEYAQSLQSNPDVKTRLIKALKHLEPSSITFWLHPDQHRTYIGYHTIFEWRLLTYLGLAEVEGVSLLQTDELNFPRKAKDARRDHDLSSGQWNWLYNFSCLTFELRDDTLVLIDEPENSLHPIWQQQYPAMLSKVLGTRTGCHALVATHSALVATGLPRDYSNVSALEPSDDGRRVRAREITSTYGWSADDFYRDVFGMETTRSPEFMEVLERIISGISASDPIALTQVELDALKTAETDLPVHDPMRALVLAALRRAEKS